MANDSTQSNSEATPEQLEQELNALLDWRNNYRSSVNELNTDSFDPLQNVYNALADVILAASATFVGLRRLEQQAGEADASQDATEL